MSLNDVHSILFNAIIFYSTVLGIWAAVMAGRGQSISGNFWGAILTFSGLAAVTLVVGLIMTFQGLRPGPEDQKRLTLYILYMAFLIVIMPGLFSMLRGRDDRSAAISFAILAFFNASVALSMVDRMVIGPWT